MHESEHQKHAMSIKLDERSIALRRTIIETLGKARTGHLGPSFSILEILRVLYDDILQYDPSRLQWPERDRFILSKGHGCLALYVMLAEKGFFPRIELDHFCMDGALLGGHPVRGIPGVEASTGSLGHGLSLGVGIGLAVRHSGHPGRIFVLVGDGECNEGSVWEAALCAGKHQLDQLTVLVDYNQTQCYGETREVQELEPFCDKWRSFGFSAQEINGHDIETLRAALARLPLECGKPTTLICHTVKGKGIPFAENDLLWHYRSKYEAKDIEQLLYGLEMHG